jgi:hypothetical protein
MDFDGERTWTHDTCHIWEEISPHLEHELMLILHTRNIARLQTKITVNPSGSILIYAGHPVEYKFTDVAYSSKMTVVVLRRKSVHGVSVRQV